MAGKQRTWAAASGTLVAQITLVGCQQYPAIEKLRRKPQIRSQWPWPQTQTQWLHPATRRSMTSLNWNFEN